MNNSEKCELCGEISDLRPYGPNEENVCVSCGLKDTDAVAKGIAKRRGLSDSDERIKVIRLGLETFKEIGL